MVRDYLDTLKHPVVGRLSLIQLISYFGTWFSQVAIFSMLVSYGADEITISFVAAMSMFPAVILAPVIGVVIDRIDFKKLMTLLLMVEISMTLSFIMIDSLELVWVLMILIFVRSSAASILFSAEMSLFPKIVQGDMLKRTNEIHSIIWSLCYASGMAVGGIATYYLGFDAAFMVDAFLYSIALFVLMGLHISLEKKSILESNWMMFKNGFAYFVSNKKVVHLVLLHASLGLTSFDALVTLLADFEYKEVIAVPLAIGWMNATRAIALTIGPFFISKVVNRDTLHYFFLLEGIAIILWSQLQFDFYWGLVGLLGAGFLTTTLWSYTYLLIQEEIEPEFLGRVISYNDMFFMLANVIVALFIGYGADWGLSLGSITIVLGVGFVATSLYYKWFQVTYNRSH
ncbi:FIG00732228: membrane protein [hydrothermal vent metagenome]|uniref:FIG00732228: membrane protein n=1 Tax=hydrothermal vent metagenome TaxID=652676 RepID=A0A1W1BW18_9ZZZZ